MMTQLYVCAPHFQHPHPPPQTLQHQHSLPQTLQHQHQHPPTLQQTHQQTRQHQHPQTRQHPHPQTHQLQHPHPQQFCVYVTTTVGHNNQGERQTTVSQSFLIQGHKHLYLFLLKALSKHTFKHTSSEPNNIVFTKQNLRGT